MAGDTEQSRLLVITGGSQGIGLACARLFLAAGYRVVNLSRRSIPVPKAVQINADMLDENWLAPCEAAILAEIERAGRIVLLHNAARQESGGVAELDAEQFRRVLQLNLVAPQQLNRLVIPYMAAGSAILYVGSTLAEKAVAGMASYVSSKHGLIGLMRATVQDLAGRGIHSVCVCPGFTDTEMLRAQIGDKPEILHSITGMVSMARLIEPEEIAETLLFCARNPVVNGAVIHANLGQIER